MAKFLQILAMKEDIDKYLAEAGEKKEVKKAERESVFAPLKSMFSSVKNVVMDVGELFHVPSPWKGMEKKAVRGEAGAAADLAKLDAYLCYKVFKQSHGMLTE